MGALHNAAPLHLSPLLLAELPDLDAVNHLALIGALDILPAEPHGAEKGLCRLRCSGGFLVLRGHRRQQRRDGQHEGLPPGELTSRADQRPADAGTALGLLHADVEDLHLALLHSENREAQHLVVAAVRAAGAGHDPQAHLAPADDVPHAHAEQLVRGQPCEAAHDRLGHLVHPHVVQNHLLPEVRRRVAVALRPPLGVAVAATESGKQRVVVGAFGVGGRRG
mmetsp:Transcript_95045/g.273588  ORF Transcript_95045/g.273588 Transcript_95045/m.273588 type:complete len:223 (+) Transcript_95045:1265-1933(+)